jgi:hypothetical protein
MVAPGQGAEDPDLNQIEETPVKIEGDSVGKKNTWFCGRKQRWRKVMIDDSSAMASAYL